MSARFVDVDRLLEIEDPEVEVEDPEIEVEDSEIEIEDPEVEVEKPEKPSKEGEALIGCQYSLSPIGAC